jgi:succinate dehydrogenase / fumarate reductase iron-sulfur subunit
VNTGGARDGNSILIPKADADASMDAAACIGCGACVAACPNASASLFTGAKIAHLGLVPQGQPERHRRALRMVERMDLEGFGHCTLHGECQEACPKEIGIDVISRMNRDFMRAAASARPARAVAGGEG